MHDSAAWRNTVISISEDIADKAKALTAAQGKVWLQGVHSEVEAKPLVDLANSVWPLRRMNGRRRDNESPISRFYENLVFGSTSCWSWRKVLPLGYGACYMLGERFAHRVSWILHNGPIPDGLFVLHKCDVRNCVNPDHLFLGTKSDNRQDQIRKGRQPRGWKRKKNTQIGENHPLAKIRDKDVVDIRAKLAAGQSGASIAREYGVSPGMIYHIAKGRAWTHVKESV